jgi:hypothetical protein
MFVFDAGKYITWTSRGGWDPGNLDFLGPQLSLAYSGSMPFHRAPKVLIYRAQPPPTFPRNGAARIKNISTDEAIWIIGA